MMEATDSADLFSPLTVRGIRLRNRIVMPPMVTCLDITGAEGIAWYARRAAGGAGLVIVEATGVPDFGTRFREETLRPLVEAVHAEGAAIGIQLFPIRRGTDRSVDEIEPAELKTIRAAFSTAAGICRAAGFDAVEPHGAHGFLLNRFFSPLHNHRSDAYGGNLEGRMRLALEIAGDVRAAAGPDMLVLYRHTPVMENSYGLEQSLELAAALVRRGVDVLDISPCGPTPGEWAAPFRRFGRPVIAVGGMDEPGRAEEVLGAGRADLIAVGRGLIADPDWPNKVREGRWTDVVRCVKCDELCFGNLRRGVPIACTQWPTRG